MILVDKYYEKFLSWRVKNIKESRFIIILSVLVGVVTGLAAVLLRNSVHYTYEFVINHVSYGGADILLVVCPFVGIWLTSLFVRYFVKDDIGHGVTKVLYSISRTNSYLKPHNSYTSMIASTLTIGFGGSVGTEATIVLTGASIGSNMAKFFGMNYKVMTLMIGCGAAGAIAGIFKAPIAGIAFTLEVIMLDMTMASIVPLMMSAMTSFVIAFFLMGKGAVMTFNQIHDINMANIPWYLLLGAACGMVSVYFIRTNILVEKMVKSIKNSYLRILMGGALLGLIIYIFPPLYGEGYSALETLINGDSPDILQNSMLYAYKSIPLVVILYVLALVFIKVIATALTNGSGGVGGVFAPSLFTGGVLGFVVAAVLNSIGFNVPVSHFVLAGMAGVMSGVMSSPLTAMFLIAEITGGYGILLPLMLASTTSYLACRGMEPHSIYARRLAIKGELITHNKDKAVLTLMKLDNVIENDFKSVNIDASLGQLVHKVSLSKRNIFPVLNEQGELLGIVLLDDVRKVMFNSKLYDKANVREFMTTPPAVVNVTDGMDVVMRKFETTKAWNLPVISAAGKYAGFVSKSKILNTYRDVLQHVTDE